jgi:hypothetical protein
MSSIRGKYVTVTTVSGYKYSGTLAPHPESDKFLRLTNHGKTSNEIDRSDISEFQVH